MLRGTIESAKQGSKKVQAGDDVANALKNPTQDLTERRVEATGRLVTPPASTFLQLGGQHARGRRGRNARNY